MLRPYNQQDTCSKVQLTIPVLYIGFLYVRERPMIGSGIKRGTAELAILSVLEECPLHGYEMARRIEEQTKGALRFTLAALYPMLYRMEQRSWIRGSWETSSNGRRRRCYRLTPAGKKKLSPLRKEWEELFGALKRLTKVAHA
jgi:PadR family transcriptional regulator, regulatory protein PadR